MQYLLDLETLLLFLGSRRQSGELSTDLKRFPGIAYKGPCRVYITLIEGKVISCHVQDLTGRVLVEGDNAFPGLQKLGQLDWTWSATSRTKPLTAPAQPPAAPTQREPYAPVPVPGSLPYEASSIPRRIVPLEMVNKNALPRKYWQILLLVDGSHTVTHIANLLMPSSSPLEIREVMTILIDLQQQGLIVIT